MLRGLKLMVPLALLAASFAAAADELRLHAEVRELLSDGWGESFRSVGPAQEHYRRARQLDPADPRPSLALALVQIKHRRYRQAQDLLQETLSLDEKNLAARQAHLWLLTLTKRYSAALVQMDLLSRQLPERDADGEAELQYQEAARLLGRMFGFLAGPAADAVSQDRVDETRRKVLARLTTSRSEVFEAGRQAVDEQFTELWLDREQSQDQAREREQKNRQEEAQRAAQDQAQAIAAKQAITQSAEQSQETLNSALSELDKQLEQVRTALDGVLVRQRPVADQLARLNVGIQNTAALLAQTDNPQLRLAYSLELGRLERVAATYDRQYQANEVEAASLRSSHTALLRRRAAEIARHNAVMKDLGQQNAVVTRTENRIAKDSQRARRPASGLTGGVRSLSAQARALTTYEPFPLEREKQRLLQSLE